MRKGPHTQMTRRELLILAGGAPPDLPASVVNIEVQGERRIITSNCIPGHPVGRFPNRNCPLEIRAQDFHFEVAAAPVAVEKPVPMGAWLFGVCINGVVLDPTGPYWDGDSARDWQFEVMSATARPYLGLDGNNAHVQPSGEYHYHSVPEGLLEGLGAGPDAAPAVVLIGYAADGFPIYGPVGPADPQDPQSPLQTLRPSYRLRAGARPGGPGGVHDGTFVEDFEYVPGLGDLDECNGRVGVTLEHPAGIYHYILTRAYPFIPRLYRGVPSEDFTHGAPPSSALPPALRGYRGS